MLKTAVQKAAYFILLFTGTWFYPAKGQKTISENELVVSRDLEYAAAEAGHAGGHLLDLYSTPHSDGKRPAILFVHGGGFWEGDKRSPLYVKMASAFARAGYVSVSVNYTLKEQAAPYNRSVLDRCAADVLAAVNWIRANRERFGIDTSRLFLCGDSAGGGIATSLCFDPVSRAYFCGCIDLWGGLPGDQGWNASLFNGEPDRHTAPVCLIHGTKDRIVPYQTSARLAAALQAAGVYQELHLLQNADHYPVQLADQFIPVMIAFTDKICRTK